MKYLHTMVRVSDIDASLRFYRDALGLVELRRVENDKGRFTLVFLAALALVMVAAVVAGGVFLERVGATSSAASPNLVEVADVVGLDEEEATAELESRGFEVKVETIPNVSVRLGNTNRSADAYTSPSACPLR